MKKAILLAVSIIFISAPNALCLPLTGVWNLQDGLAAVLDPENDGGEIGDEAAGRDTYDLSEPWNEYYWRFDGLIRTENIIGAFNDNGNGTGYRDVEVFRTGGTFQIHGDTIWGQAPGTIYEVSIDSHFVGVNNYIWDNGEWQWDGSTGSTRVWGKFIDDPFLFQLTDNVNFYQYGYNPVVNHNVYLGTMTDVVMTVSPVPEPATMLLLGTGLVGLAAARRKKFRKE